MCHKRLSFNFGPQINFIIGKYLSCDSFSKLIDVFSRSQRKLVYEQIHSRDPSSFYSGGKSAVLSAITVALGGKAQSTGRGNGLRSFIREGEQ